MRINPERKMLMSLLALAFSFLLSLVKSNKSNNDALTFIFIAKL